MRYLLVHNRYRHGGGEDEVFDAESSLLRSAGHEVVEYTRTNNEIEAEGFGSHVRLGAMTVWSRSSARDLGRLLADTQPDLVHFHNTLPLISPAAYYVCDDAGVPVVQTLHNYRLICPAASLFREGRICEECVDHGLLNGLRHRCYRDSRGATATVTAMLVVHRALGTWRDKVDRYIVLSEFARRKLSHAGLPAERVVVKPNFVDPQPRACLRTAENAIFVGRLAEGKGVRTLIDAWGRLRDSVPLEIVGDGPERVPAEAASGRMTAVRFRGRLPRQDTLEAMRRARFLVFPSESYETFGLVAVEAFASGVPVIASRLGAMEEIVAHGRTGLHFKAGDAADLAAKVSWAWSHPQEMEIMGRAARAEFEAKYTPVRNYELLMKIYAEAIASAARRRKASADRSPEARTLAASDTTDSCQGASH